MLKRLIVGVTAALTTLAFAPAVHADAPTHTAAVELDGWASAMLHGHVYNCFGYAGYNSACVDPTTGYGPVIWLCTGTNCSWSSGISSAAFCQQCDTNPGEPAEMPLRWNWNAGSEFFTGAVGIGVPGWISPYDGCNSVCGAAFMSQAVFNQVIYISNSSGIDRIHFVH